MGKDPAICCQRFDPSADINGAKKSSMSDPNADTSAQICPTVRSKVRTHRSVCSEVRSRCGHFWRFIDQVPHPILTSNKTKDEFFFVECASVVNHHFNITVCHHRSTFYQIEQSSLGIIRGNPGVFQLYPYPTLQKPLPLMRVRVLVGQGKGFSKPMGLPNSQGYSPNLM